MDVVVYLYSWILTWILLSSVRTKGGLYFDSSFGFLSDNVYAFLIAPEDIPRLVVALAVMYVGRVDVI